MNVGIIGLGLMGGSFGRTLVKQGKHKVYAFDINPSVMLKGEMIKAYHEKLTTENAKEIDMLVVALYPKYFKSAVSEFLPLLKDGAIVSDFCGIKRKVEEQMRSLLKRYENLIFIGGHPMAGREFSGIEKSTTTLFDKASMILINVNADIFTMEMVKKFYLEIGFSQVVITTSSNHDSMIAYTSQLCHIVSNAFIKNKQAQSHNGYSAGSYKDLTRVARLEPTMWTELIMENREMVKSELDEFIENLTEYKKAIDSEDNERLYELLKEGNERKLSIDTKGFKEQR